MISVLKTIQTGTYEVVGASETVKVFSEMTPKVQIKEIFHAENRKVQGNAFHNLAIQVIKNVSGI